MVHARTDQRRDDADIQYIIRGMSLSARAVLLAVALARRGRRRVLQGRHPRQAVRIRRGSVSRRSTARPTLVVNASLPALVRAARHRPRPQSGRAARPEQNPRSLSVAGHRGDARQPAVAPRRPALRADPDERARRPQAERGGPVRVVALRAAMRRTDITCSSRKSARRR